jgi:hypothetical protein
MVKSCVVPFHLSWDMNYPFVQSFYMVCATCTLVTSCLSQLRDQPSGHSVCVQVTLTRCANPASQCLGCSLHFISSHRDCIISHHHKKKEEQSTVRYSEERRKWARGSAHLYNFCFVLINFYHGNVCTGKSLLFYGWYICGFQASTACLGTWPMDKGQL